MHLLLLLGGLWLLSKSKDDVVVIPEGKGSRTAGASYNNPFDDITIPEQPARNTPYAAPVVYHPYDPTR